MEGLEQTDQGILTPPTDFTPKNPRSATGLDPSYRVGPCRWVFEQGCIAPITLAPELVFQVSLGLIGKHFADKINLPIACGNSGADDVDSIDGQGAVFFGEYNGSLLPDGLRLG